MHLIQLKVPPGAYRPTAMTAAIHRDPARFRVLSCGRRFGKSWFAMCDGFLMSLDVLKFQQRPAEGLVVAPTYEMVEKDWRISQELFKEMLVDVSESRKTLTLNLLGRIEYRSTETEGGVARGGGYDWVICDEAAKMPRAAWEEDIRPALADRQGRAIFISTPHRRNFFYDLYLKGKDTTQAVYRAWQFSTMDGWRSRYANDPERLKAAEAEWEQILTETPSKVLAQEYLGEFLDNEGTLWTLDKVLRGSLRNAQPERHYVAGIDVAHVNDFMATVVIERETRQVVAVHRSRYRDWLIQKAEAAQVLAGYPGVSVVIDATGLGDPIAQDMARMGFPVEHVVFTPQTKKALVRNLSVALDHGYLGLPDQEATQWLKDELLAYQEIKLASGDFRYGAPEGQHDDGVTALMLACWPLRYEWQAPIAAEPQEAPSFWTNPVAMRAYRNRVKAWERSYPGRAHPSHPRDIAWQTHRAWERALSTR